MKKLPKDYYLSELFTNSLQGKSWLEVGNDLPESSAKLSKLNKCRDFKVASRTPRAPHMIRFAKEDLSAVPDDSFDYVLFNWSIGMFATEVILKEASRIAREGVIIQDYLLGELSPKVPGYTFYTDLQWREILNSFGQIHVEMQIPEQALELPMRKPPQVRLYVVQVADNRDTLRAAPHAAPHAEPDAEPVCENCGAAATCHGSYEMRPEAYACDNCCHHGNEDGVCEPVKKVIPPDILESIGQIWRDNPVAESIDKHLFPKLMFRAPQADPDDFAINTAAGVDVPSAFSMPAWQFGELPPKLEVNTYYNGQDMVGDSTPLCPRCGRNLAPDDLPEETIQLIKEGATPPLCVNCQENYFTRIDALKELDKLSKLSSEELEAEVEKMRNTPLEELTPWQRMIGRAFREGQEYSHAEYSAFLESSSGQKPES